MDESITHPSAAQDEALDTADDLPVVARLVVEIRSDGSRTVARGAIEDSVNGQQVGVEAKADSPLELSRALAKMVLSAPFAALLGRQSTRSEDRGDAPGKERRGLPGRVVGAIGRKLGKRLDRSRLLDRD